MSKSPIQGKTCLITGATGSFGQAMTRRFLADGIGELRVYSRDEKKQEDMRLRFKDSRLKFVIGDVRSESSVFDAMRGVDFVFHAAALKQVPSCEFWPMEAVRTNVLGTENVLNAAIACGVERVIALSTDKAVYPINAMGISKAMMEKIVVAKSRNAGKTTLCATRYGNVMASRGSVIPLFLKQIREGGDITVTDPEMTRFLMSLADSVDLVLFAYTNGEQGDIFVQKAPAATIGTLAEAMRVVFDAKCDIRVIGTRHGEKRYESLVSREEMARAQDLGNFYRIPSDDRDLNYEKFFTDGEPRISEAHDYTSHNTRRLELPEVVALLRKLNYVQRRMSGQSTDGSDE